MTAGHERLHLHTARNPVEGALLQHELAAAGIRAHVEDPFVVCHEMPTGVRVWIPSADRERARTILADFLAVGRRRADG